MGKGDERNYNRMIILMFVVATLLWIFIINNVYAQASYSDCDIYGNCKPAVTTINFNNNTGNVNNSQFLQGLTPAQIAALVDLTGYVPYTGATGNVVLGNFNISASIVNASKGIINRSSCTGLNVFCVGGASVFDRVISAANGLTSSGGNIITYDDNWIGLGTAAPSDFGMQWNTVGNDRVIIGTGVGTSFQSGYINLLDSADSADADRTNGLTSNPIFRIWSANASGTDANTKYVEFSHDDNNPNITSGKGNFIFNKGIDQCTLASCTNYMGVTNSITYFGGTYVAPRTSMYDDGIYFYINPNVAGSTSGVYIKNADLTVDQTVYAETFYGGYLKAEFEINTTGNANIDGNVIINGNLSVKRPYAMFSDNTTQVILVASTAQIVNFSTIEDNYLINLAGKQNISVLQSGDYYIDVSAIYSVDTPNKHVEFWLQKTNSTGQFVNVPRSNTKMELSTASLEVPLAVSFIVDLMPTDKIRFMTASDDAGSELIYTTNTSYSPETPSIIINMHKISEIT